MPIRRKEDTLNQGKNAPPVRPGNPSRSPFPSLGSLYKDIPVSSESFFTKEDLAPPKEHPFILFCRDMGKRFPAMGKGASYNENYKDAITFLGWKLRPEDFSAAVTGTMVSIILVGGIISVLLAFLGTEFIGKIIGTSEPLVILLYTFFPVIILGVGAASYVQSFPLAEAKREQIRALTYVPDMIGYLIMSMKLVPNLEKSVEFAADHGKGRIAVELKRIIWNTQLGVYNTIAEGLDELAYNWGKYSSEFKQALMNIRASVLENTEAKRYQLLDKTMDDVLASVQDKMEQYARDLSQPSTTLFYVGVLLPLILIIILPVGSAFSGSPLAQAWVLFLIYAVILPLLVIWFARSLLGSRPPTYTPPEIPDNYPTLSPNHTVRVGKGYMNVGVIVIGILLLGGIGSTAIHFWGIGTGDPVDPNSFYIVRPDRTLENVLDIDRKPVDWFEDNGTRELQLISQGFTSEAAKQTVLSEKTRFFALPENDITPYNLIFGLMITLSIAFSVYVESSLREKRKVQEKFMTMESEFKDSLYVLASRLGENKPIEDALRHTQTFLPNNMVSQEIFGKTIDNIHVLGMPLENAVFDPAYGSMKNNPSLMLRSAMKIAIDSVRLGSQVAARTLISLSRQLGNAERVSKLLTTLIRDITGTMKTVAVYISPIVLGITTSLQRVVIVTLVSINSSGATQGSAVDPNLGAGIPGVGNFSSTDITSFIKPEAIATLATPGEFLIIVALYVVELVLIMTYFITLIEENNPLQAKLNAARSLPIAMVIFVATVIISNILISGNFG